MDQLQSRASSSGAEPIITPITPDAGSTVNVESNDKLSVEIPSQESNQGSAPTENNIGIAEGVETFDLGFGDIELHVSYLCSIMNNKSGSNYRNWLGQRRDL